LNPGGGFYTFLNTSQTGMTCEEFTTFLLHEANAGVVPGTAFGSSGKGFVRISYATSMANLEKAASRIKKAMDGIIKWKGYRCGGKTIW